VLGKITHSEAVWWKMDESYMFETAICGWSEICRLLGHVNRRTMMRRRDDMLRHGVIFYRVTGKPPRKNVYAFPSIIKAWTMKRASEGKMF